MITKGIVEKVIDQYSVKVRLPLYDGAKIGTICVDTDDLSNATICTVSGMIPALKVGDVVFVGFEDNDRGKPVVLGYLYNEFSSDSFVDLTLNSLRVNVDAKLPIDTSIGNVDSEEIQSLLGVRGNIQGQLDLISSQMDASNGTITGIKVNGILVADTGIADLTIPYNVSDLNDDVGLVIDSNYVHTDNNFTDEIKEDIERIIEEGGEPNVIEIVRANGTPLIVASDKSVNIPLATSTVVGLVKSSTAENTVSVSADGVMNLNDVNVNKLSQTDGDELILDCCE